MSKRVATITYIVFAVFFTLLVAAFIRMALELKGEADGKEVQATLDDLLDENKTPVGSYVNISPPLQIGNIAPLTYGSSTSVSGYAFSVEGFPSVVFYADDDEDVGEELEAIASAPVPLNTPVIGRVVTHEYGSDIPSGIEKLAGSGGAYENIPLRIIKVGATKGGEMLPVWFVTGAAVIAALIAFSFWSAVAASRRKQGSPISKA